MARIGGKQVIISCINTFSLHILERGSYSGACSYQRGGLLDFSGLDKVIPCAIGAAKKLTTESEAKLYQYFLVEPSLLLHFSPHHIVSICNYEKPSPFFLHRKRDTRSAIYHDSRLTLHQPRYACPSMTISQTLGLPLVFRGTRVSARDNPLRMILKGICLSLIILIMDCGVRLILIDIVRISGVCGHELVILGSASRESLGNGMGEIVCAVRL
jgi:hypothetical protein